MTTARKPRLEPLYDEKEILAYVQFPEDDIVLVIEPKSVDLDPVKWASENMAFLQDSFCKYGAVLFRNWGVTQKNFQTLVSTFCPEPFDYLAGVTLRPRLKDGTYVSTAFPPQLPIIQHQDQNYMPRAPMKLFLCCQMPAEKGGCTPVVSIRRLMKELDPVLLKKFEEKGVTYIRNYAKKVSSEWRQAFETDDKSVVESFCKDNGLQYEWLPGDRLRTTNTAVGVATHPRTGEKLWFNQGHHLNMYSEDPKRMTPVLEALSSILTQEEVANLRSMDMRDLPYACTFGDGSIIPVKDVIAINEAFVRNQRRFEWQKGDFLAVDNMILSHGRDSFVGSRRLVLAAMGEAITFPFIRRVK